MSFGAYINAVAHPDIKVAREMVRGRLGVYARFSTMDRNVLKVDATSPKEEVASLIAKYNLLALPVVDARRKLLGTVTVDDVVDIMLPRGWKKRSLRSIAR